MRIRSRGRKATLAVLLVLGLSACSTGIGGTKTAGGTGPGGGKTLTIGFVSPRTGPLAAFGQADAFVIERMKAYFAGHPITAGTTRYSVKIVVKDAQSDAKRAGEVAAELINTDNVDLLLASSTPDIVNPVSEQCEANSIPCITTVAPWQPFAIRGHDAKPADLHYSYHFFWGLEDVAAVYSDMWAQLPTNKKAAGLFPNDPDGQAWAANFPALVSASGTSIDNPGLYPNGTQDFTAQVSKYKGSDILLGVPIPPDFTTFWKQAKQQGYHPMIATIGKALLFPSSVEALGDIGENLGTEVWWHPTVPFKSSLTGQSAKELADAYESATHQQWTQPLGFVHALFEVAAAAVRKAGSTDPHALVSALRGLDVSTVVGDVAWGRGGVPPYIAKTPLTGGQWRRTAGGAHPFELVIVSNRTAPMIPTGGKVQPLP
jgi:branched-chain amino acid transport system substrate-binding protein